MEKRMITKMSLLLAVLFLLVCLPVPALAGKGSAYGTATPSNAEKEEETEGSGDEAGTEAVDGIVLENEDPEEEPDAPEAPAAVTEDDIAGTWTIDGVTSYRFEEGGAGALLLPEHDYAFAYTLEEDTLILDFESAKIKTAVFRVFPEGDDLVLTKEEEAGTAEFLLQRTDD